MIHLSLSRAALIAFLLSTWTMGQIRTCGELEYEHNKKCCKKCPPGTYLTEFCSANEETSCVPCKEGTYAENYHSFDRCDLCRVCDQGKLSENCTKTTNGKCSCRPGFLCSDHICSSCVENKCSAGEKVNKTDVGLKYSYQCEPKCPGNQYFDAKEDICKPWTKCSEKGLVEVNQGNTTHDSVCGKQRTQGDGRDLLFWIMSISFILLSLALSVFVFYTCLKNHRKNRENRAENKISIQAAASKTSDFHLSKEESGFHLIIQEEFKVSPCVSQPDLENVSILSSV